MTSSVVKDLPSTTSRDPSTAAVAPNDSKTTSITSNVKEGEVYRRADGKLVRRVVRKKKRVISQKNGDPATKTAPSTIPSSSATKRMDAKPPTSTVTKKAAPPVASSKQPAANNNPPPTKNHTSHTPVSSTTPRRPPRQVLSTTLASTSGAMSINSHQTMQSHKDRAAAVQGFEADLANAADQDLAKKKARARRPPNPQRPGAVPVAGNRRANDEDESLFSSSTYNTHSRTSTMIEPVLPTSMTTRAEVFENEIDMDTNNNNNTGNLLEARLVDEEEPPAPNNTNGLVVTGYLVDDEPPPTTNNNNNNTSAVKALPMGNSTNTSNTRNNDNDDKHTHPKRRRCRWILVGSILGLLLAAGAVAGVLFAFVLNGDDNDPKNDPKANNNNDGPPPPGGDGPGGDGPPKEDDNTNDNNGKDDTFSPTRAPVATPNPPTAGPPTNENTASPTGAPSPQENTDFFANPLLDQVTPIMHTYEEWQFFFVEWGFFLDDCQGTAPEPPPTLVVTCQARPELVNLERNIHLVGQLENDEDRFTTFCEPLAGGGSDNQLRCTVQDFGNPSPPPKQFQTTLLFVCGGDSQEEALPLRAEVRNVQGVGCGTRESTDDETGLTEFVGEVSAGVAIGMVCIDEANDGVLVMDQEDTFCNAEELNVGDPLTCVNDSSCQSDTQFECDVEALPIITARNNIDDNIFGQKQCAFTEKLVTGEFDYDIEELWTLALENGFGEMDFAAQIHLAISLFPMLPDNNLAP